MSNFSHILHEDDVMILMHLRDRLKVKNPCYYKAKYLAKEIGGKFTSKMVGTRLGILSQLDCEGIKIRQYADSGLGFTWRIENC